MNVKKSEQTFPKKDKYTMTTPSFIIQIIVFLFLISYSVTMRNASVTEIVILSVCDVLWVIFFALSLKKYVAFLHSKQEVSRQTQQTEIITLWIAVAGIALSSLGRFGLDHGSLAVVLSVVIPIVCGVIGQIVLSAFQNRRETKRHETKM